MIVMVVGLVFLVGLCLASMPVWWADRESLHKRGPLSDILPTEDQVWKSKDVSLGDTEMMTDRIERILQYDEVLFRQYSDGRRAFAIYIAYWRPGAITPRDVEFHTPDRCWIHAGWNRVAHDTDYRVGGSAKGLAAGQWRIFEAPNTPAQEVVFWHVVDGEVVNYSDLRGPSDWAILGDLFRYGVAMKREQYFIRINSGEKIADLANDPFFKSVMVSLKSLGLYSDG